MFYTVVFLPTDFYFLAKNYKIFKIILTNRVNIDIFIRHVMCWNAVFYVLEVQVAEEILI